MTMTSERQVYVGIQVPDRWLHLHRRRQRRRAGPQERQTARLKTLSHFIPRNNKGKVIVRIGCYPLLRACAGV